MKLLLLPLIVLFTGCASQREVQRQNALLAHVSERLEVEISALNTIQTNLANADMRQRMLQSQVERVNRDNVRQADFANRLSDREQARYDTLVKAALQNKTNMTASVPPLAPPIPPAPQLPPSPPGLK